MTEPDPQRRASADLEPLLSIEDVVRVLGISESGIYRLVRSGDLPRVKVGSRTLFERAAIRSFIARRREASQPHVHPSALLETHHA